MDHINGGGSKHAQQIGRGKIYRWLILNDFPEGFRVLCHNCNLSLGYYGYCPHQRQISPTHVQEGDPAEKVIEK
jgi:hypothetical protein